MIPNGLPRGKNEKPKCLFKTFAPAPYKDNIPITSSLHAASEYIACSKIPNELKNTM